MLKITRLVSVVSSAFLFAIPFLFSKNFAFLILFFLFPLFYFFSYKKNVFISGFLWGLIAFGLHFIWLCDLLLKKSNVSWVVSFLLYFFIVVYSALTSGFWFKVTGFLQKILGKFSLLITTPIYFFLLDNYMFWFLDSGYPFLNPLILLMRYKIFSKIILSILIFLGFTQNSEVKIYDLAEEKEVILQNRVGEFCKFVYLKPCEKRNSLDCALELYDNLKALNFKKTSSGNKHVFVLGPETTFPLPLNKNREFLGLWKQALPEGVNLMIGSTKKVFRRGREKTYQVVYWLKQGLIMQNYVKSHRVSFTEKIPRILKKSKWAKALFLENKFLISKGKNRPEDKIFKISPDFVLKPVLCSELFMKSHKNPPLIVAFVNDNWFCSYFRRVLRLLARLKAVLSGQSIVYVGHAKN